MEKFIIKDRTLDGSQVVYTAKVKKITDKIFEDRGKRPK